MHFNRAKSQALCHTNLFFFSHTIFAIINTKKISDFYSNLVDTHPRGPIHWFLWTVPLSFLYPVVLKTDSQTDLPQYTSQKDPPLHPRANKTPLSV